MVSTADLIAAPVSDRLTLPRLAALENVSPVSTWRWALRGVAGIKLPTFCVGRNRYTTRTAYREWCEQVTAARNGERVPSRTNRQRDAAIERAERELEAMGV